MTADEVLAALDFPEAARVERRVPKTLFVKHGSPTAADKRRLNDGIEQVTWVATLKPTTVGVAAYRDEQHEYLEIAVLRLELRGAAKLSRLLELVHRAVPYPLLAVTDLGDRVNLSLAHKRWSQGESGKTVLDGSIVSVDCPGKGQPHHSSFKSALAMGGQPSSSLLTLFQGWMDALLALEAARLTNHFEVPEAAARRAARQQALSECERLEVEMGRLRTAAAREKQMARQVELNLELKRVEASRASALARL